MGPFPIEKIESYVWIPLVPVVFCVYLFSFSDVAVLAEKIDMLANADTASQVLILEDFSLSKKYGDEWKAVGGTIGDNAQKLKMHHVLFYMLAHCVYRTARNLTDFLGVSSAYALYSVSAVFGCLNLVLLYQIMRRVRPAHPRTVVYALLYAFSLSTWIYASIPETWIFSATLLLGFILIHLFSEKNGVLSSVYVGLAMLANMSLFSFHFFTILEKLVRWEGLSRFLKGTAFSLGLSLIVYFSFLTGLSFFDDSLRPSNMITYSHYIRNEGKTDLPTYGSYYLKGVFTNQFINSVVSHQPYPKIPLEALLYTLRGSLLGVLVTLSYLGACALALFVLVQQWVNVLKDGWVDGFRRIFQDKVNAVLAYSTVLVQINFMLQPQAAFLYSTIMVPIIVLFLFKYLEGGFTFLGWVWPVLILAIILNNFSQILLFREALLNL